MSKALHGDLKRHAKRLDISVNELCQRRLLVPGTLDSATDSLRTSIQNLKEIASASLVGIAIFGSWARHDSTDTSDIDVLVVLESGTAINRSWYRQWESRELANLEIEPHFVSLPTPKDRISGLWAEVAMDGVIVTDPDYRLQGYLSIVRRAIAAGTLMAKKSHGQTYWVHLEVA